MLMEWTLPSVDSSSVCACTGMQVMARKGCSKLTAHKHVQQRKSQHNANMQCTHCFVCCNTEPIQGSCRADVGRPGDRTWGWQTRRPPKDLVWNSSSPNSLYQRQIAHGNTRMHHALHARCASTCALPGDIKLYR
jgi:hypothetical protein